jgi:hypothetical protein
MLKKVVPIYISIIEDNISKEDVERLNEFDGEGHGSFGDDDLHQRLLVQPKVYLGHASFEAAGATGQLGKHISRTINRITRRLKNSTEVISDEFIALVKEAFTHSNGSIYPLGDKEKVVSFIETHKGKECFVILGGPEPTLMGGILEEGSK